MKFVIIAIILVVFICLVAAVCFNVGKFIGSMGERLKALMSRGNG